MMICPAIVSISDTICVDKITILSLASAWIRLRNRTRSPGLIMSFNRIGNELNQIAKVANSTQSVYAKDIEDMKKSFEYFRAVFGNYLLPLKCEVLT